MYTCLYGVCIKDATTEIYNILTAAAAVAE